MRTLVPLLGLLLISIWAIAQPPKILLTAGGTAWRNWVNYEDGYESPYKRLMPFGSIGMGVDLAPWYKTAFEPEMGLEYYGLYYQWSGINRPTVDAKVSLFSLRLSPGLRFNPIGGLHIRVAMNVLLSCAAFGSYRFSERSSNGLETWGDEGWVNNIRKRGNFGPELGVALNHKLRNGGSLGPRIVLFVGGKELFKSGYTPHNPRIFRLGLELNYTLPSRSKTHSDPASDG